MERRSLDEEDIKYCKKYLKETEENKNKCLQFIRDYIAVHDELIAKTDDYNLIRFLRACKYNQEKALEKLTNFYTLRGTANEWFQDRDPTKQEIQNLLKIGVFLPLLKQDSDGCFVILIRIAAHNPKLHKQNDVFKVGMMTLDLLLDQYEVSSVYGVRAVFDMKDVTLRHACQLTVPMIKKAVHSWQDCYPVRVKSLDFVNSPSYINVVLNIFRRFMNEKIRNRVHVHGFNRESLHKIVSKDILPEEYGGSDGKLNNLIDYWTNTVTQAKDWFSKDEQFKLIPKDVNNK